MSVSSRSRFGRPATVGTAFGSTANLAWAILSMVSIGITVAGIVHPLSGQGFNLRLERGEIGVDGRGLHQAAGVAPGALSSDYQQWLRLPVSGYLVHPRVLRYTFALRPLFGQHLASTLGQGSRTRNMGLDLSTTAFAGRRMTLSFQATRSSGASRGDLGAHNEFDNEGFTALMHLRDRYFPTTITYSDRSVRDTWESPFTVDPIARDQRSSRLRAEVRNKKLTTILERTTYRDLRGTGDHDARSAQARHRITWGKGSSLLSSLNVYRREGSSAINRTSWSERALIAHTREISTSMSFSQQSWGRNEQGGKNLSYDVTSRYSPAIALEGAMTVNGQRFTTDANGDGVYRLRLAPSFRYILDLPADTRFHMSTSLGSERLSRTVPSDLPLDVIEESHEVEEIRIFSLDQLRVEAASIEIWDEARTILLAEGIDYRVVEAGPVLEIQILPGSRVSVGEVVLVTYSYRTLAAEDTRLFSLNYETTLRRRGLSLRHGRRQRSEDVSSANGTLAHPDDVDLWFGVTYSGRTKVGGITLEAVRRSRAAAEIEYSSDEFRAEFAPRRLGAVETRLRGTTSRTIAGDQVTRTTSAGLSTAWRASRTINANAGIDGWVWGRDDQPSERFLAGHMMMTWRFGEVSTVITFDQVRRTNGLARTENRWSVRAVRRF